MVTVRHGTLQVIHLTVKEFLRSSHGLNIAPYSNLLVNPEDASFQLTLVCLKCIGISCVKPIADLGTEALRIDINLPHDAMAEHLLQAPLVEYASLSWVAHLTDCGENHLLEILQVFNETFESRSTFGWVEAYMIFQPDDLPRLLVGLDEILAWISSL